MALISAAEVDRDGPSTPSGRGPTTGHIIRSPAPSASRGPPSAVGDAVATDRRPPCPLPSS